MLLLCFNLRMQKSVLVLEVYVVRLDSLSPFKVLPLDLIGVASNSLFLFKLIRCTHTGIRGCNRRLPSAIWSISLTPSFLRIFG